MTNSYIFVPLTSSWSKDWKKLWFYVSNPDPIGFPLVYRGLFPVQNLSWTQEHRESDHTTYFANRIGMLRQFGLTGWHVARDFISKRLSPLKARMRLAWEYSGDEDASRDAAGCKA
jgi:hypothetical protein